MPASYVVTAVNPDSASANRIHSDEVAQAHGFRGALVPGVVTYGHMCPAVVVALGAEWTERGEASVRFTKPVYDGDAIEVAGELTDAGVTVRATNAAGDECAVLTAALPAARPTPQEPRGLKLMPLHAVLTPDEATPAGLLRLANRMVTAHFQISPWIHAASDVRHWRELAAGMEVDALAGITALGERRGHKLFELDVLVLTHGAPVGQVRHTVIYELATPGDAAP